MKDITALCHAGEVDDEELASIFSDTLHQATFTSRTRVDMPDSDNPRLTMTYTKAGRLTKVESNLSNAELQPIFDEIQTSLLDPTTRKVSRSFGFSDIAVEGTWGCDLFTITAAPPTAPRPPVMVGDYPYVFEIPFPASSSWVINNIRIGRRLQEYDLLLNVFTTNIKGTPLQTEKHWGIAVELDRDVTQPMVPQWVQRFYWADGFITQADDTTPVEPPLIASVPDNIYYSRRGTRPRDVMTVPESLAERINRFRTVADTAQGKFLRSAYWLRHASAVYQQSRSATLIATIQAIEALLPKSSGTRCPTCGLQQGNGPTANFSNFLNRYVPTQDPEIEAARKKLYNQRSQLTHGHELLVSDTDIGLGWRQPSGAFEWGQLSDASTVARLAAINWLASQRPVRTLQSLDS